MRRLVYLFFFFSGLCGLVYEVLWTRLFVLVMGGTVYSFTTEMVISPAMITTSPSKTIPNIFKPFIFYITG